MPILVDAPISGPDGPGVPNAVLHDGHLSLGAITLGATDDFGVEWLLEDLKGWDTPATTGTVEQRASDHGGWLSPAFYAPRSIEITGSLLASTWDAASRALDRLFAAIPLNSLDTLTVVENERTLQADVRQDGDPLAERTGGWARFSLSLIAPDPRRYATTVTTAQTGLPTTTGGLSTPLTTPLTINPTVTAGVLSVTNDGNMATPWVGTITGPSPAFSLTHRGTGKTLRVAESVAAGRSLTLDSDKRRGLLDGESLRVVTGSWFDLEPGVNEIAYSASSYDPAARFGISFRSAWR